jgi:integrase
MRRRGLRHGFGVNATVNGVPLNALQKWLGHSNMKNTAIYADAVAEEAPVFPCVSLAKRDRPPCIL